jgi:3-oxoacyl-(acyl-carrier-protein) synthase
MAPNGIGKDAFWESLLAGRSGIGPVTLFDASRHPCKVAGEVRDFDPAVHLGPDISSKRLARQTQLALAAAFQAVADARLSRDALLTALPVPLILGVSSSAIEVIERGMERMIAHGPERVPFHVVDGCRPHQAAGTLTRYIPFLGSATTVSSACSAGLDAIASAARLIRDGRADVALAGGADAPINALTMACLAKDRFIAPHDHPARASSPFSADRKAGVVAEGAGLVVLESLEHARARGATPYLEFTGCASRVDPCLEDAESGFAPAMKAALANACHHPEDTDYICAHGPGDPLLDRLETQAIKAAFGRHAYRIPITSIKGVTGNPFAAAGAFQVAACALVFRDHRIPPTANLDKPDPECDLDYVPGAARHADPRCILILSHGMGGGNSCLVVERVDPG